MDDEDYAEFARLLEDINPGRRKAHVPLVGYDEVVARLDNLFDALNAVNETLLAAPHFRRKHRQAVRAPRPETASQRLKRRQAMQRINSIVEHMTGGR